MNGTLSVKVAITWFRTRTDRHHDRNAQREELPYGAHVKRCLAPELVPDRVARQSGLALPEHLFGLLEGDVSAVDEASEDTIGHPHVRVLLEKRRRPPRNRSGEQHGTGCVAADAQHQIRLEVTHQGRRFPHRHRNAREALEPCADALTFEWGHVE